MMKRIIIIGTNHHNTLSMVRCIGKEYGNITLILVGNKGFVAKSKYVKDCIVVKDDTELKKLIETDSILFSNSIIISCSDSSVQVLDNCRNILPIDTECFSCSKPGQVTDMMDKTEQVKLAQKHGFKVPQTMEIISGSIDVINFSSFPCILKPNQSYVGGKHIEICKTKEDLIQAVSRFQKGISLQIQQFIAKELEIVIPGYSSNHVIETPAYILKHRDNSGATTFSTVKNFEGKEQPLLERIRSFIKDIGYDGLFGFEFIYSGEDYYFIELNLRNDATCYSLAVAGYNLPIRYIQSKLHQINIKNDTIPEINSIVEFNDFSFVLRRKLGVKGWLRDLKSSKCKFYYDPCDIKPFIFASFEWLNSWTIKKLMKRLEK